jgi:lantibiotic biosynthesis dehydratase-like protein
VVVPGIIGTHRWVDAAVLRASAHLGDVVPVWWPDNEDAHGAGTEERWCEWLAAPWAREGVAAAVTTASPTLAARISEVCGGSDPGPTRARRLAMALARYLVRMRARPTPFGLFAGVAPLRFGDAVEVRWSDHHRVRARPDALWLAEVIDRVEFDPQVLGRLRVVPVRRRSSRIRRRPTAPTADADEVGRASTRNHGSCSTYRRRPRCRDGSLDGSHTHAAEGRPAVD